jgi:phage terminase Nu1 subunit (DNA packaging protein)
MRKNPEAVARGRLRSNEYSAAKTRLAEEQARRIAQLRRRDERSLIPADEVRRVLVATGQSLRQRLLSIEQRLRASHPNLDKAVYQFLHEAHTDALQMLSQDVLKLGDE